MRGLYFPNVQKIRIEKREDMYGWIIVNLVKRIIGNKF